MNPAEVLTGECYNRRIGLSDAAIGVTSKRFLRLHAKVHIFATKRLPEQGASERFVLHPYRSITRLWTAAIRRCSFLLSRGPSR